MIFFLLTTHFKRLLTSALIHFLKTLKEYKVYQKYYFTEFLSLAIKESYIIFESSTRKLTESLMGSPLVPTLANAFLVHFEKS